MKHVVKKNLPSTEKNSRLYQKCPPPFALSFAVPAAIDVEILPRAAVLSNFFFQKGGRPSRYFLVDRETTTSCLQIPDTNQQWHLQWQNLTVTKSQHTSSKEIYRQSLLVGRIRNWIWLQKYSNTFGGKCDPKMSSQVLLRQELVPKHRQLGAAALCRRREESLSDVGRKKQSFQTEEKNQPSEKTINSKATSPRKWMMNARHFKHRQNFLASSTECQRVPPLLFPFAFFPSTNECSQETLRALIFAFPEFFPRCPN